ncbi:MAG: two pore domain potassium channel family protein [Atopobiaceae bacterium]|nr:two pore domain potassium channel family protein [Atopobiaceae bacterium]
MKAMLDKNGTVRPLKPRIFWTIVRVAGLMPMTVGFAALFGLCAIIVAAVEQSVASVADAAWYLFTVVTTIGFGDFTCNTVVGRLATVVLSIYSIFYIALLTAAVVSYCSERLRLRRNESVAAFIDKLERLPEMSHEELVELSEQIKRL